MTAIAGFTNGTTVWIGGDAAGSNGHDIECRSDPKVFKNGEMVMGFTTSFRMGQILQYQLTPPTPYEGENGMTYMVKRFIPAVKQALRHHGFETCSEGRDRGGTFLVGYRGVLYEIQSDYQVARCLEPYHACGSGHALIRGAFYALDGRKMTPEARITVALEAAEKFSAGVRAPFTIISTTTPPYNHP